MPDSPGRSFVKSMTWRVLATLTTAVIVFASTGEWQLAITVGSLEFVAKFVLYYVHERVWQHIGLKKAKLV